MLSLILALVCAFVGSLFLFGGMMLTVPKKEDFEFKDRLRAYQASSTFGDVIESTDLACSFMSAALFIADTYLARARILIINTQRPRPTSAFPYRSGRVTRPYWS